MAQPVEQWITDIPPVTRAWVIAAVGASLAVVSTQLPFMRSYGLLLHESLYLSGGTC